MMKNYYVILEVPTDASDEQIRSAYRKQVKALHPDHYGEDSGPFKEVQEAYHVLSDPEQRRNHDRQLQNEQRRRPESSPRSYAGFGSSPIEPVETPVRRPVVEEVVRPTVAPVSSNEDLLQRVLEHFFRRLM